MPISAVDLFCGVGGLTHGLQLSGIPVVAGLDVEHSCQYAYEQNNNARFILRDITQVTGEELNNYFLPNTTKVLVGCAPCQPFSTYSLRYNKNGKKDNKWRLLYYFADLAETVLPEVLSMENVPQLVNEKVFKDFLAQLDDLGYYYSWKIVNCADYGVPQCRRRLVLLASRLGNIELIPPIYDENNYITVRDAIGNLPALEDGATDPNDQLHRASRLSEMNRKRIRQSVPGGSWKDWDDDLKLPCHKKTSGKGYRAVYGRMEWDKPSPTITTQYYGYGNGRFGHGFAKTARAKSTPRVRFEAISVGVALALREKPDLVPKSMDWLNSPEFHKHTTTHASNSPARVSGRILYVKNQLLEGVE